MSPLLFASAKYLRAQVLTRLGLRKHQSGSTTAQFSIDGAVGYILRVARDYLSYGANGDLSRIRNAAILEIGPGDNLGVALLLLAWGARSVTCVDGFEPFSSKETNRLIYRELVARLTPAQQDNIGDVIERQPDGTIALRGTRLTAFYETPIEAKHPVFAPDRYSIILSRAVLEHVHDLNAAWNNMVRCLTPDGEMWHKIDFRCHNFFGTVHPLYFLTFGERLWRLISSPDPTLNRARLPEYVRLLDASFGSYNIFITHSLRNDEIIPHVESLIPGLHYADEDLESIRSIQPRLTAPFRMYAAEDLLVNGVFLVARKKHVRISA